MAANYLYVVNGVTTTVTIGATDIGYTKGAIVIACDVNVGFIEVDQEPLPVDANILTKGFTLKIPFAEASLTNIALAWDQTVATLGTVVSAPSLRTFSIVQPGIRTAIDTYKVRTWTFTNMVASTYGEHSTDNGANPVVMTTEFRGLKPASGASWNVAEV